VPGGVVGLLRMARVGGEWRGPLAAAGDAVEAALSDDAAGLRVPRAGDLVVRIVEEHLVYAVRPVEAAGRDARRARIGVTDQRAGRAVPHVHPRLHFTDAAAGVAGLRSAAVPAHRLPLLEGEPAIDRRLVDEGEVRRGDEAARVAARRAVDDRVLD